jgi:colicin import membrane protein
MDERTGKGGTLHAPRELRTFRIMVIVSVSFHVCLLLAVFIVNQPMARPLVTQEAITTKLVRLGQDKKDWLPRKETPPPPPKEEPAAVSTDAKAISTTRPKEDNKSKFDDVMKRLEKIEKQDDYKGKGDPKGSKSGQVSEFTQQMIGMQWMNDVDQRIRPNFVPPSVIAENERSKLSTVVVILVNGQGRILKRSIETSSGNALYDAAVLRALDQSNPLPPPPPEIREQVMRDGLEFTFSGKKG